MANSEDSIQFAEGSENLLIHCIQALLTMTQRPVCDLFATDFFATDWRSMRLVQPLYAILG